VSANYNAVGTIKFCGQSEFTTFYKGCPKPDSGVPSRASSFRSQTRRANQFDAASELIG
jgi:hypothetical protein